MVPEEGLEPSHLSAYAPQAYVSTIPPSGQDFSSYYRSFVRVPLSNVTPLSWMLVLGSMAPCSCTSTILLSGQKYLYLSMVPPAGLEPTTHGFEDRYSIQLS